MGRPNKETRMEELVQYLWILLPLAFGHGWFVGRHHGVKLGAAGMFDQLYDNGTPVVGRRGVRMIEVSIEDDR